MPINSNQLILQQLTDSALPVGGFSHSLGFETYMHEERITDEASFGAWLEMFIHQQLTFTDALAVREVDRASVAHGEDAHHAIMRLDQEITALTLPTQIRKAQQAMGFRLLQIALDTHPNQRLELYAEAIKDKRAFGHQSIVFSLIAFELGMDVDDAVAQHLFTTVISLTQNAVRAVPLGQAAGQRIIARAIPLTEQATATSATLGREDLGAIAPGLEIAQMKHERQRARLFMS